MLRRTFSFSLLLIVIATSLSAHWIPSREARGDGPPVRRLIKTAPAQRSPVAQAGPANIASNVLSSQFDQEIDDHFDDKKLPGLVVLMARDGLLTYRRVKGKADVAGNVAMSEHKIGRLNSVSKLVGSVALVRLEEQGKIDLKAKASSYIADLPAHHNYRVLDLLACRSGVRHYGEPTSNQSPTGWSENDFATAMDVIPNFWHDPLASPSGSYHYSSFGYTISDACAEQVSGKSFSNLLVDLVSNPAGASSLKVENLEDNSHLRVKFYTVKNGQNVEVDPPKKEWTPSGGGMQSTPLDLLKFGIALMDGKIIKKSSVERMMKRLDPNDSYAIGCSTAVENGYHVMAKDGSAEGSNAYIWMVPERRMVMVVMANRDGAGVDSLGKRLRQIALGTAKAASEEADLVIEHFARTAAPRYKDGYLEIPVTFKVVNQGKAGANISFINSVKVEGVHRWTGFMDALPREDSETVNAVVKVSDPNKLLAGRKLTLQAFADAPIAGGDTSIPSYARIDESSENNNTKSLEVQVPGGLDLKAPTRPNADAKQPSRPTQPTRVPVRVRPAMKKGAKL